MAVVGTVRHRDISECEEYVRSMFNPPRGDYIPRYKWDQVNSQRSNSFKSRYREPVRHASRSYYTPKYMDILNRVPTVVKDVGLFLLRAKGIL